MIINLPLRFSSSLGPSGRFNLGPSTLGSNPPPTGDLVARPGRTACEPTNSFRPISSGEEFAVGGGRAFLSRSSIARALKVPTVLLFVGGMMFLSGQGLFAASFFQGAEGALATIPAGSTWAYVYPIKVLGAGPAFGEFASPARGAFNRFR